MKKQNMSMTRREWRYHQLIDYADELLYHMDCIEDEDDYPTDMDATTIVAMRGMLNTLRNDLYEQLTK